MSAPPLSPTPLSPDPVPISEDGPLAAPAPELDPGRLTYESLLADREILALVNASDAYLEGIGYTDHGLQHLGRVSARAYHLLEALEAPARSRELAAISGLLHDIGNVVHRLNHAHHSALLAFQLLKERGLPTAEIAVVIGAIANHDDESGDPISEPSAALIIADKSDVHRSRVRNPRMISFDIHDRVNYAATASRLEVDRARHLITLDIEIDTQISQVMEYFEIFMSRMRMCRRSANYLNCDFRLVMNDVQVL